MYGLEWFFVGMLLGAAIGAAAGAAFAGRRAKTATGRSQELEAQLAAARSELARYRQQVTAEFSTTAQKFQSLNDAYSELHLQLARSSSILCADVSGPLLAAPPEHRHLEAPSAPHDPARA